MEILIHSRGVCVQILRQRILEFLLPLTGQYGVNLMASLGEVWSRRKSKRRPKNKVSSAVSPETKKGQIHSFICLTERLVVFFRFYLWPAMLV